MKQYLALLQDVIDNGVESDDRTGTGTLSVFGRQLRFDLSKGFPLMTTKRVPFKSVLAELLWFLKGDDNIEFLLTNGCTIWNEWAETEDTTYYKLSAEEDVVRKRKGDLGPLYPVQWRRWNDTRVVDREDHDSINELVARGYVLVGPVEAPSHYLTVSKDIDQISNVIESIKNDPYSRRHIVSTWNVGELDDMNLNPCHYTFQFYVRDGKLSLMWNQRSVDTFLGLPFNIASYALLTHMVAQVCGLEVGELVFSGADVHLYKNHIEQAELQLTRDAYPLPTLKINKDITDIDQFTFEDFSLEGYEHHPTIKAPVAV